MRHRRVPIARRTPLKRSQAPIPRSTTKKGTRTSRRRKKRLSLSKQADTLWARIVHLAGRCEECGSVERLQAAHGFCRRYRGTRWLPINGFCLCARHHVYWTHRPLEWDTWLRGAWGPGCYDELRRLALATAKPDLPAIVAKLKAELDVQGAA